MCKFGSFKSPLGTITSLSKLYFRFRKFILLVQTEKVISMAMVAAQAAENHGDEWGLLLRMMHIYINFNLISLTKFLSSSGSTEFKDILPWNIFQMITKTIPISTRIDMKQGILFWVYWKVNENWDNNMIRISQWREAIVEQILVSE